MLEYAINFKLAECSKSLTRMDQAKLLLPIRLAAAIEKYIYLFPLGIDYSKLGFLIK